ncbi:substrate-binding periplasmic protein [Burkholderiaceae bacterium UC74_6]
MPLASRRQTLSVLLAALSATCSPHIAQAAEPGLPQFVEVGTSSSDQLTVVTALLREAYKRVGVELRVRELPMRRRLLLADNGTLDGDLARVAGVQQEAPQLIRVNVPVYQFALKAYRLGRPDVDCPASIRTLELGYAGVAVLRGHHAAEQALPTAAQVPVNSYDEAARQLQRGKVAFVLAPPLAFEGALRRTRVTGFCAMSTDTETHALFHMLHRRHAVLAARLEQVLGQMQQSGEMSTILANAERQLLLQR